MKRAGTRNMFFFYLALFTLMYLLNFSAILRLTFNQLQTIRITPFRDFKCEKMLVVILTEKFQALLWKLLKIWIWIHSGRSLGLPHAQARKKILEVQGILFWVRENLKNEGKLRIAPLVRNLWSWMKHFDFSNAFLSLARKYSFVFLGWDCLQSSCNLMS